MARNVQGPVVPVPLDSLEAIHVELPARNCPGNLACHWFYLPPVRTDNRCIRRPVNRYDPEILPFPLMTGKVLETTVFVIVVDQISAFLSQDPITV